MTDRSELWNSPAISAFLVWSLARGYSKVDPVGVPILLVFLGLTLVSEPCFFKILLDSGLVDVESLAHTVKASYGKDSVSFGGITQCIANGKNRMRTAIEFALAAKLVALDASSGRLVVAYCGDNERAERHASRFRKKEGRVAERLGTIFAETTPERIATLLGVNF